MRNKRKLLATCLSLLLCGVAACNGPWSPADYGIHTIKDEGFELKLFDRSETLTRLIAVNASGAVIGMREVPDEKTAEVIEQRYFYHAKNRVDEIPPLEGFSNVEVLHLSDSGHVVGFASRRIGHQDGSLVGIVWDPATKTLSKLPPLEGDVASHAQCISADGERIVGYSTGSKPARLRPCVWTRTADEASWEAESLPTIHVYNPYLMSSSVVISPNGKLIAAAATESIHPNGSNDSSVFVWQDTGSEWKRKLVSPEPLRIHAVSNDGVSVGELTVRVGRVPCKIALDGTITLLKLLDGDLTGEAWSINNEGVVVGISDNLTAPDGGPRPVIWQDDQAVAIQLPGDSEFGGAYGINDSGQIAGMSDFEPLKPQDDAASDADAEGTTKPMGFLKTVEPGE